MRITLGDEIAKRLCLEPEYIRIEFSAMIPGLQAGRWDMINTGIFWTEERAEMMQMIPYESPGDQHLGADRQSAGHRRPSRISPARRSASRSAASRRRRIKQLERGAAGPGLEAIDIRTFDNFAIAYQALRAGQIDATVSIDATAAEYAKRGEFDRALSGLFPTPVALAHEQRSRWPTRCSAALNSMMEDGYLPGADRAVRPARQR